MGFTMMPIMTSALRTLASHEVARGSTLMNIIQQVASSIGVAVMAVLLTNSTTDLARLGMGSWTRPELVDQYGQEAITQGLVEAGSAFASTFWVAASLVALTLVPAMFLPRKREVAHLLDDQTDAPPVVIH